jgi:hypothetical protein
MINIKTLCIFLCVCLVRQTEQQVYSLTTSSCMNYTLQTNFSLFTRGRGALRPTDAACAYRDTAGDGLPRYEATSGHGVIQTQSAGARVRRGARGGVCHAATYGRRRLPRILVHATRQRAASAWARAGATEAACMNRPEPERAATQERYLSCTVHPGRISFTVPGPGPCAV